MTLEWIPSHSGFVGNELADRLANGSTRGPDPLTFTGPEPVLPISSQSIKTAVKCWQRRLHTKSWESESRNVERRRNIKSPLYDTASLSCLNRQQLRWLVFIYTGHSTLYRHLHTMGQVESPLCADCGAEDETALHHVGRCPIYIWKRDRYLYWYSAPPDILKTAHRKDLLAYLIATGRFNRA